MHQRHARGEFSGAIGDMFGERIGHRRGRCAAGPEPAFTFRRTQRRLRIAAQRCGESALKSRRGAHLVNGERTARTVRLLLGARGPVPFQRGIFAFNSCKFGLRSGIGFTCIIACLRGIFFQCAVAFALAPAPRHQSSGGLGLFARFGESLLRIACAGQGFALGRKALGFARKPFQPCFGLRDFGLRDAPVGFHASMVRRRLGQRQFGRAARPLAILKLGGKIRALGLVSFQRGFTIAQRGLKVFKSLGRILCHAVSFELVFLQPFLLPIEIAQALFRCFKLAGERGHAVSVGAGIIAAVRQLIAQFGEFARQFGLRLLCRLGYLLRASHLVVRSLGLCAGSLCSRCRITPAREQQARFGNADFIGEFGVSLGLLGLPLERGHLRIEARHQIFEPFEVLLGRAQFQLGIAATHMQAGNACRFFQHHAPFGRLGSNHLRDLALAHEGRRMRAGSRIGEDQRHVLRAHIAAIHAIGAARAALDPAGDIEVFAVIVLCMEHDFGEIALRTSGGAREDHVLHSARPHGLGRVFAHHPADCFEQIGFAAAIGPDNAGKPRLNAQFRRFDEAFEAAQAKFAKLHPSPAARLTLPVRRRAGEQVPDRPRNARPIAVRSAGKWGWK